MESCTGYEIRITAPRVSAVESRNIPGGKCNIILQSIFVLMLSYSCRVLKAGTEGLHGQTEGCNKLLRGQDDFTFY